MTAPVVNMPDALPRIEKNRISPMVVLGLIARTRSVPAPKPAAAAMTHTANCSTPAAQMARTFPNIMALGLTEMRNVSMSFDVFSRITLPAVFCP